MDFIKSYTHLIEEEIKQINLPDSPENLYAPLRYFMQIGGKRMRPILTILGAELFGKSKSHAINAAMAVEVFHNFTLIHDDIMDEAPLRRGNRTVHTKWNTNIAILSGDVLFVKAYELLAQQETGDLRKMLQLFNKTAIEVCEGQQLDMDFESLEHVSVEQYTEMIRLKTSVLLGCALELGAMTAEASDDDCKKIYDFGVNLGIAFQIQDDILDLYADPDKFGKQVGGDVLANKKTMLYLKAKENANLQQLEILKQLYTLQDPIAKVEQTRQLFDQIGARMMCAEIMEVYYQKALTALNAMSIQHDKKEVLIELGDFLLIREH